MNATLGLNDKESEWWVGRGFYVLLRFGLLFTVGGLCFYASFLFAAKHNQP